MPKRDKTGPAGTGDKDGSGDGKGRRTGDKGSGSKTGGEKGDC